MSVQSEITRISNAVDDTKTAIEEKGVKVPGDATVDDLPTLVRSIETGGGGASWVTISETLPNAMYQLGDVLMDGSLTQDDAMKVMNYLGGSADFSSVQKVLSDVNFDGIIGQDDAMSIIDIVNGTYTPTFGWATAVEYASAKVGDDVKAIFEITVSGNKINAPTYAYVPWDGIIAIYSNAEIPAGTTGLIQILK